ncbi:MAG: AraC family transcriptional regulator [Rhodoferax sp.]|nr:AraC family transcriptional regulator [Rhodoferax sp.]
MATATSVVRSASLHGYADLARQLGLDPNALMRSVGLSPRCTDDPETPISATAVRDLLEASARAAEVEDFGLQLARGRRLANLGPISIVLREEPTARLALDTLSRYLRLLNASLLTRIEDAQDVVIIREEFLLDATVPVRQSIELAVGVMFRILQELLGPQWRPRGVCFSHRAPGDSQSHRRFFGVQPEFNGSFNGIVCAARDLQARSPTADSGMAPYARRFLDQTLSRAGNNTSTAARQLVAALLPGGRCTAEQVAQHLSMDRRTLHRHLQSDGETFSSLMQDVRSEFALRQIADSDHGMAELAELLGFSGASAFAFWFRRRFGCTVSSWRNKRPEFPSGASHVVGLEPLPASDLIFET